MPPERDWRAPPDEAGSDALAYSDIALGYLSRNPTYRADYARALRRVKRGTITAADATTRLVRRWGISFHAEPATAFDPKLAVARPDLSPTNIVLAPAPVDTGATQIIDEKQLGTIRARMRIGKYLHVILADADGDEHVWIAGPLDGPLAMMLPIDADPFARLAAAERLCRRLNGMTAGPPTLRPPPFRRLHLLTLLQVLDGLQAGATQRELATSLIHQKVRRYSAADWVESSERKRVRRWIAEAVELRDGGYVRLLRGG